MSLQVIRTLPQEIGVAVSGGIDSMVLLSFLHANKRNTVTAVHYVHDSEYAEHELEFVDQYCIEHGIDLLVGHQVKTSQAGLSKEEYWRNGRYDFFKSLNMPICTAHTLDDVVETYLFTSMHGEGRFMNYSHANVIRPLFTSKKSQLIEYAEKFNVPYMNDPSNQDVDFAVRNRIRHNILPEVLKVNPGLFNMVRKRVIERMERYAWSEQNYQC